MSGVALAKTESMCVHVTWVPYLQSSQELKTKPTQNSLRDLRSIGITPDLVVLRADYPIGDQERKKIALFGNISFDQVIPLTTQKNMYLVPECLQKYHVGDLVMKKLGITKKQIPNRTPWDNLIASRHDSNKMVTIGIVGKYTALHDAYISVKEAVKHAGFANNVTIKIVWINSEDITPNNVNELLKECDGIIVPGGFGERGVEGKIVAAHWARISNKPYLGICLGMQVMCIEFARQVLNDNKAHSHEFDSAAINPIISLMDEQFNITDKGGTMRLGAYPCSLKASTKASDAYQGATLIQERHRHRFEFNNSYRKELQDAGLIFSGISPDGNLVEIVDCLNIWLERF